MATRPRFSIGRVIGTIVLAALIGAGLLWLLAWGMVQIDNDRTPSGYQDAP